jgi:type 1 glutamine amidotransferase
MYLEALKWSMGMTDADATPRPLPPAAPVAPPSPASDPTSLNRPDTSTRRLSGQPPKMILALGDVSTSSYQHDSMSHALAAIEEMGLRNGLYDTLIRTDTQLVTRGPIATATGTLTFYKNLEDFDAVVLFTSGDPKLTAEQKSDLRSFLQNGKGLVLTHSALSSFHAWPEFARMAGGAADENPGAVEDWEVTVPDPDNRIMSLFPKVFRIRDNFSAVAPEKDVRVLARTGSGIPVAWTKAYGKGRVFVTQFGHEDAAWDRPDIRHMYYEAIRWAIGTPAPPLKRAHDQHPSH